jgi:predicted nucleotidyltransferase
MRLTPEQIARIRAIIAEQADPQAAVWLFGSRVDDAAKGGDVDLYVEADALSLIDELRCKLALEQALDLPVDLIVRQGGNESPIARIAKEEGVRL